LACIRGLTVGDFDEVVFIGDAGVIHDCVGRSTHNKCYSVTQVSAPIVSYTVAKLDLFAGPHLLRGYVESVNLATGTPVDIGYDGKSDFTSVEGDDYFIAKVADKGGLAYSELQEAGVSYLDGSGEIKRIRHRLDEFQPFGWPTGYAPDEVACVRIDGGDEYSLGARRFFVNYILEVPPIFLLEDVLRVVGDANVAFGEVPFGVTDANKVDADAEPVVV
jgi:hypothetical protein